MRVLIPQQFHLGHHYQYVAHLLPDLTPLVDEVVVAITAEGAQSTEFRTFLAPFARAVRFEPVLPPASAWIPMSERWRVHSDLRRLVRRFDPDYVLIPSGDAQTTFMALFRLGGLGPVPGRCPCEVGIHLGSGSAALGFSGRARDRLNQLNLALAGVKRVHLMNLLFYEQAQTWGPLAQRFALMPHPVPANPRLSKGESRRRLGIPEDGRYIGLAASLDSRKAIAEFLAAFRAASQRPNERLLLVGWINDTHTRTIEQSYADLVREQRLIVIKGFQAPEVFQTALSALDVVCTPYPGFGGLSSTLLEGVAAGRPVLVNSFGWSQAIVTRFGLGWTCDVLNHEAFTTAVRGALDRCDEYRERPATSRLLAFHAPENFAKTWLQGIREAKRQPPANARSWAWVADAIAEPLRQAS